MSTVQYNTGKINIKSASYEVKWLL